MSVIKLLPRPTWPSANSREKQSYWVKYRCSTTCSGHIIPLDRVCEFDRFLQPSITDYGQWVKAREQEFRAHEALVNPSKKVKKLYTARKKPRPHIRIFGE